MFSLISQRTFSVDEVMPSVSPDSGDASVIAERWYQMPSNWVLGTAFGCVRSIVFTSPAQAPNRAASARLTADSRIRRVFIVFISSLPFLVTASGEESE